MSTPCGTDRAGTRRLVFGRRPFMGAGGIPATAAVNAIQDTGTMINNAPVCELDLTVTVPGSEPYRVTHRQLIATAVLPHYRPGATFAIRVDENDRTQLIFG